MEGYNTEQKLGLAFVIRFCPEAPYDDCIQWPVVVPNFSLSGLW